MDKVIEEGALRLLITESTCDVILSCSDHRLMAHKLILSIASPVLRELLQKHSFEATPVLILPDIKGSTMSQILDYIYTGTVVIYTLEEFLSVAKFLKISVNTQDIENNVKKRDGFLIDYSKAIAKSDVGKGNDLVKANLDEDLKKRPQKILPDLLPIDFGLKKPKNRISKMVVPSPWCRRDETSFLGDPRVVSPLHERHEDSNNNNFQVTSIKKPSKCLDTIINNLYLNNPEIRKEMLEINTAIEKPHDSGRYPYVTPPQGKMELPNLTNFPFSRHLTNLSYFGQKTPEHEDGSNEVSTQNHPKCSSSCSGVRTEGSTKTSESAINDNNSNHISVNSGESSSEDKHEDRKKGAKKLFKCEECGKCFSQLRNYKYHRSMHEGTKEFSARCPECDKTFNDRGYLSSHMKIHRDRKEYACPHCPKRFNQKVAYNMHLRIHTGVKPHECPTCGKSFSRKMLLKQHQRVHTGERPYSCPECGKSFADRSNMSLHARLHTGVKPYACTLCPKSFTKKHHLKTHMNFHTGVKPYSCENCGLAFSQSSNMRTHYKKCVLKDRTDLVAKTERIRSVENNS
ncbi:zinc finger protein 679-like isoform X2 [Euwallacea fornicatus]